MDKLVPFADNGSNKVVQVLTSINALKMSDADLVALNKGLIMLIKAQRSAKAFVAGTQFVPGQIVTFRTKTRGTKRIKIEKFNRAGTCVVGKECLADGTILVASAKWTVGATLCVAA
jgi:hypothetical protein